MGPNTVWLEDRSRSTAGKKREKGDIAEEETSGNK
jgi:hypothetical protein